MKVLNLWITLLALYSLSYANESLDDSLEKYISDSKKKQFEYSYEKNEAESSKLRDSWIAPFNITYSLSRDNSLDYKGFDEQEQQSASIKWNQPIFQSGGIYYGIKYAKASGKYADYSVDVQKRKLIKDAISILFQIKQADLRIKRQNLQIKNAEIALEQKKEQYLSGQLDSSFLDSAIIDRNNVIQALYDIETSKERLISTFEAISDMDYSAAHLPNLKSLTKEQFLSSNIVLKMSESEIEKNDYFKDVTIAKYLPKISFTAGYSWSAATNFMGVQQRPDIDYYNYGLSASIPLDINTADDITSYRVDYLKSKVAIEDKRRELSAIYDQVIQNMGNYEKKKQLSLENKEIYEKLLSETKELSEAGYKTSYDVDLLENSFKMAEIDFEIFEIDKQLELLTLYEMYKQD
ncbi:MAG: TolC family protein [Thiovulaceae bacterium]|nr:TolC family protein [Sulfurimonadaceae bacterium]MCW9026325.1 TolC family protein [Sulfurimonadaceae bacterium]